MELRFENDVRDGEDVYDGFLEGIMEEIQRLQRVEDDYVEQVHVYEKRANKMTS